jgi:hypothetical protein
MSRFRDDDFSTTRCVRCAQPDDDLSPLDAMSFEDSAEEEVMAVQFQCAVRFHVASLVAGHCSGQSERYREAFGILNRRKSSALCSAIAPLASLSKSCIQTYKGHEARIQKLEN